jgi:hypothetical protein
VSAISHAAWTSIVIATFRVTETLFDCMRRLPAWSSKVARVAESVELIGRIFATLISVPGNNVGDEQSNVDYAVSAGR